MARTYEVHFQEGFTGQTVELLANGRSVARFQARTRPQLGLAHIERLDLEAGQLVAIHVTGSIPAGSFRADEERPYVRINVVDNALVVKQTDTLPGYV